MSQPIIITLVTTTVSVVGGLIALALNLVSNARTEDKILKAAARLPTAARTKILLSLIEKRAYRREPTVKGAKPPKLPE